jgi:hypothetical protein
MGTVSGARVTGDACTTSAGCAGLSVRWNVTATRARMAAIPAPTASRSRLLGPRTTSGSSRPSGSAAGLAAAGAPAARATTGASSAADSGRETASSSPRTRANGSASNATKLCAVKSGTSAGANGGGAVGRVLGVVPDAFASISSLECALPGDGASSNRQAGTKLDATCSASSGSIVGPTVRALVLSP